MDRRRQTIQGCLFLSWHWFSSRRVLATAVHSFVALWIFLFLSPLAKGNIALVQHTSVDAATTTSTSLAFKSSNTAGNWIAVCIRAGISSSQVFTVKDSIGNTYKQATQVGFTASGVTLAIYYAENILAGGNTVTVADTVAGPIRLAILEYSGVATSNSLDVTAAATAVSASPNSGNVATTASGDLLLGAIATTNGATFTAGTGYKIEELVPVTPNPKLIAEDQAQTSAGVASASASLAASDNWGAVLAAFRAASGGGGTGPTITILNPTSGPVGNSVAITGTNFGASQGTSTVTFNGTAAAPTFWSATTIAVPVPAGATSGNVVVTVGGVASNAVNFTVTVISVGVTPATMSLPAGFSTLFTATVLGGPQNIAVTWALSGVGCSGSTCGTLYTASGNATGYIAPSSVPSPPTVLLTATSVADPTKSASATITVTPPPPSITTLNPTSGPAGFNVTITGTNFGATQGTSTVSFNGVAAAPTNWSASSIIVPVPAGATTGNVVVTVGGMASNGVAFTVLPTPNISSLSPTSGPVGTPVTITGTNFGAAQGINLITFNGVAATATSWTPTSIVVPVPAGATTGNVLVTIGGVLSNGVAFTPLPTPSITSLNPASGPTGTPVTITGTNFGATQGSSTVTFNGVSAGMASGWSQTGITVVVPAAATTGNVVVTVGGLASNGVIFTIGPDITPPTAPANLTSTAISPAGVSLAWSASTDNVGVTSYLGERCQGAGCTNFTQIITVQAPNTSFADTSLVATTSYSYRVRAKDAAGNLSAYSNILSITTPAGPVIQSWNPSFGPIATPVTITGTGFGATQGTSTITFNGVSATPTSWSDTSISVTVPIGAATGSMAVTVAGVSSTAIFVVTPTITSLNPTAGPVGSSVTITGTNFGSTVGASTATFNGIPATFTSWSDVSIVVIVPFGATSVSNVVVTVGGPVNGHASNSMAFTVLPTPNITSVSPTTGHVGTPVTIAGTNFGATQGTSTVTFNGAAATPTSWSATSITVPVPPGATMGNVVVTVGGVPSNGVPFTVAAPVNIVLVQHTSIDAATTTSASLAFKSNNTAGNWIAVSIRAGVSSSQVFTVRDSNLNTYRQAAQLGFVASGVTIAIYYAENITGGANTVTVSDTIAGPIRLAILEYSGVATSNSLDVTAGATAVSASPNSGNATTTANGDLLLGTLATTNGATFTAGAGYKIEELVPVTPNPKLIAEDQIQTSAGVASASATIAASDNWGAILAAFRAAGGVVLPIFVNVTPATVNVATGNGTQNFTATVANDSSQRGVSWSLTGAGCSGSTCGIFTQITTTSVTYHGPANVPSPATVTLTATAVADTTKTATATITVTPGVLSVLVSPKRAAVTMSASQAVQITATVTNDPQNLGVTWQVDGNNGGNPTTGTVSAAGLFTPGTQPGQHTVTAVSNANPSISASTLVAVTDLAGVYLHHNDPQRTGQNLNEYGLTPSLVNSASFGQLFSCPVDGVVYAQPLWVANLTFGSTTRNVVFIVTEHDSVYAFDADSPSCVQLWKVSFLGTGVTTLMPSDVGGKTDVIPEIGITSTPVIDPATNTIYVAPKTKETVGTVSGQTCTTSSPCFVHRLHAMDLITGVEKFGGPVVISAANFSPHWHLQRPALLLANNTIYIAFGSHGDLCPYYGWFMGYNASTLVQVFVRPLTNPAMGCSLSGDLGAGGIWESGAGPAADAGGNVYVSTGNGAYDGSSNWGDSAVKLGPTGSVLDWFTPFNEEVLRANDVDLGSAGVIILPDSVGSAAHPHLALTTGKTGVLYLLDQTNMGKFNSTSNNDVQEAIPVPPPNSTNGNGGMFGVPAYWNGNIYTAGVNFPLSQFQISNGVIVTPQSANSTNKFPLRGATPVLSANGTANGVAWILDLAAWQTNGPAILDAYDATNVSTLLYSSPGSGSGAAGPAVKFTVPTVANGRVYIGGQFTFTVFGLLPN